MIHIRPGAFRSWRFGWRGGSAGVGVVLAVGGVVLAVGRCLVLSHVCSACVLVGMWYTSGRPVLPVSVAVVAVSLSPVAVSLQAFPVGILFPIFSPDSFPDIFAALSIRSRSVSLSPLPTLCGSIRAASSVRLSLPIGYASSVA